MYVAVSWEKQLHLERRTLSCISNYIYVFMYVIYIYTYIYIYVLGHDTGRLPLFWSISDFLCEGACREIVGRSASPQLSNGVVCAVRTRIHIYHILLHTLVQMFRVYALYMISKNSFRKGWGVMGRFWGKVPRKVEVFGGRRFQITLWEGFEKLWKRSHRRIAHWQFFSNIINSSCCLAYDLILFRLCVGQDFQREKLGTLGRVPEILPTLDYKMVV